MILGLGTDIIEIFRIKASIERHLGAFLEHVFTPDEIAEASKRKDRMQYYAGRWAAKEALSKALGCGIGANCGWHDICILNGIHGAPEMTITGKALESASAMGLKKIHVSISHEKRYAAATVIIEG